MVLVSAMFTQKLSIVKDLTFNPSSGVVFEVFVKDISRRGGLCPDQWQLYSRRR